MLLELRQSLRKPALLVLPILIFLSQAFPASGAQLYASGSTGYDISWPQCVTTTPRQPYRFAVVGVTGGRAFTDNPCLARQYRWALEATDAGTAVSFYINVHYASPRTNSHGWFGPFGSNCRIDTLCFAQNFGWKTAKAAFAYALLAQVAPAWLPDEDIGVNPAVAANRTGRTLRLHSRQRTAHSQALDSTGPAGSPLWWLDVEIDNTWSPSATLNRAVIAGASAYLTGTPVNGISSGLTGTVGIYSVTSMWNSITGGWSIPGVPIWVAGASQSNPSGHCTPDHAFGNGNIVLVQYSAGTFDGDYAC